MEVELRTAARWRDTRWPNVSDSTMVEAMAGWAKATDRSGGDPTLTTRAESIAASTAAQTSATPANDATRETGCGPSRMASACTKDTALSGHRFSCRRTLSARLGATGTSDAVARRSSAAMSWTADRIQSGLPLVTSWRCWSWSGSSRTPLRPRTSSPVSSRVSPCRWISVPVGSRARRVSPVASTGAARAAVTTRRRSRRSRRAANASADNEASSAHWMSSTTTTPVWLSA